MVVLFVASVCDWFWLLRVVCGWICGGIVGGIACLGIATLVYVSGLGVWIELFVVCLLVLWCAWFVCCWCY